MPASSQDRPWANPANSFCAFHFLADPGRYLSWNFDMQKYLPRKEVAELFPITESTLAYLAHLGRGPRYFRPS